VRFLYSHEKLDRIVEGKADVLIENGQLHKDRLGEEFITLTELEAAARRQGFASLADVERAVLEPGGIVSFSGKKPAPEEMRHREVLERLDQLMGHLRSLRPAQ